MWCLGCCLVGCQRFSGDSISVSASIDSVETFIFSIELGDPHLLSLFSILGVLVENFLQNSKCHITDTVSPLIKVSPCGLTHGSCGHIPLMFQKSLLNSSFSLPYVLLGAFFAPNQIHNIACCAAHTCVDVNLSVVCS